MTGKIKMFGRGRRSSNAAQVRQYPASKEKIFLVGIVIRLYRLSILNTREKCLQSIENKSLDNKRVILRVAKKGKILTSKTDKIAYDNVIYRK
jgi:predicted membrane-bound spermidine synthase